MRSAEFAFFVPSLFLATACASASAAPKAAQSPQVSAPVASTTPAAPAQTATATAPAPAERSGIFVPAEFDAVAIWPEAYSGELLVTDVKPQGANVEKGEVIATLEMRSIDEQLHQAELEARSARIRHEGVVAKNVVDDDAAAAALDQAKSSLDRARRALEGWMKDEIPFARRGEEIGKKSEAAGIDDQKDELAQLEKMYSADELVDATEEIVMKRAKRRLAISEEAQVLTGDRRQYRIEYDEAMQTEVKQENVKTQELALDRLTRSQAIERKAREDALARSADTLKTQDEKLAKLTRDKELLAIRAPRAGVLLHGKAKDYRLGRTPARYERGSTLSFRGDLFLVASPEAFAVALDVPESVLENVRDGQSAEVRSLAAAQGNAKGTLHVDPYPAAKSGGDDGVYEALVDLDAPIPGVKFGMRAKVSFPAAGAGQSATSP